MDMACDREPGFGADAVVFVVDDDISVRESLEALIRSAGWHTETFACAREFLARPQSGVPSCLILDVCLPDLNGLDVQERLSADRINMPIIFITGLADVVTTVRAMKAGAVEYFAKPLNDEVILSAIQRAIDRSNAAMARETEMLVLQDRYKTLSFRERQVMNLVVEGHLNKQIGGKLNISEITVKAHRGKVMRKMKAASLAGLIRGVWMLRDAAAIRSDPTSWTGSAASEHGARQDAAIGLATARFAPDGTRFGATL